jgi:2-formylbenzoate dehydrogenase
MTLPPDLAVLLDREWPLLIGGRSASARSGRYFDDESPVTEQVIAQVPDGRAEDVEAAAQQAEEAAREWRRVPARERGAVVGRLAGLGIEIKAPRSRPPRSTCT